jgi:hypothetical protein
MEFDKFLKYYYENKEKILYKSSEKIKFVGDFFDNLEYISFDNFLNRIKLMTNELINKINQNSSSKIHLIINNPVNKANTWVALLFMYFIENNKVIDIMNKNCLIFHNPELSLQYHKCNSEKTIAIIFDDVNYTGNEIGQSIIPFRFQNLKNINYELILAIPYISNIAIDKINDYIKSNQINNEIILLKNTKIFYSQINNKNNVFCLFFEHKMKATISFFHELNLYYIFLNRDVNKLNSFLQERYYNEYITLIDEQMNFHDIIFTYNGKESFNDLTIEDNIKISEEKIKIFKKHLKYYFM